MIHALGNLSSRDLIRWRSSAAISLITIFLMISRQLRSNMGRLGRLAAWHLTGGPVGPAPRWAATSNVEVGQTIYPVNRRRVWREGREGSEGQSHNDENREEGRETGEGTQRPLAQEAGLYLDTCTGAPEFPVTPLLMGPVCLLSHCRFKEPVRPCGQTDTKQVVWRPHACVNRIDIRLFKFNFLLTLQCLADNCCSRSMVKVPQSIGPYVGLLLTSSFYSSTR